MKCETRREAGLCLRHYPFLLVALGHTRSPAKCTNIGHVEMTYHNLIARTTLGSLSGSYFEEEGDVTQR